MQKAKTLSLISIIIGLLAVVTLVASVFTVTSGSVFNISIISMIADKSEEALIKADSANRSNNLLEASAEERAEFEQATGISVETVAKDLKEISLNDIIKYGNIEALGLSDSEIDEFEFFRTIIIVYAAFIGFFSLLAALLKCRPLTYIAMTISLPYFILFAGFALLFVFLAFSITHIVLVTKAKIAKKEASIPTPTPMYPAM